MSRKEYDKYIQDLMEDERRYAAFLTHCSFALIGANWVMLQSAPKALPWAVTSSLLCAVLFLFVRAMRHRLRLAHTKEVLDRQADRGAYAGRVRSRESLNTAWGTMGQFLNHMELPLIVSGAGLFITAAVIVLIKAIF